MQNGQGQRMLRLQFAAFIVHCPVPCCAADITLAIRCMSSPAAPATDKLQSLYNCGVHCEPVVCCSLPAHWLPASHKLHSLQFLNPQ